MSPFPVTDGHGAPGLIDGASPGKAAIVGDVVAHSEDAVRQPLEVHTSIPKPDRSADDILAAIQRVCTRIPHPRNFRIRKAGDCRSSASRLASRLSSLTSA